MECPPLRCPAHGFVDIAFVDIANTSATVTEVVYTCEEGFVLRGDHKRYCQRNGQWTGRDPHCSVAKGEAESVEQSDVEYAERHKCSEMHLVSAV